MRFFVPLLLCAMACGDSAPTPDASEDAGGDATTDLGVDSDPGADAQLDTGQDTGGDGDTGFEDAATDSPPDTSTPCRGEGEPCRDPIVAAWTDCRYMSECGNTGARARTTTVFNCRDMACVAEFEVETDPSDCARDTTNAECMTGGLAFRCCEETCVNLHATDTDCGACGVQCRPGTRCTMLLASDLSFRSACGDCNEVTDACDPEWTCVRASGPDICTCNDSDVCGPSGDCIEGYCVPI